LVALLKRQGRGGLALKGAGFSLLHCLCGGVTGRTHSPLQLFLVPALEGLDGGSRVLIGTRLDLEQTTAGLTE
jgi:hypothetical protein